MCFVLCETAGVHLFGPLHGCRPPCFIHHLPRRHGPRLRVGAGLGPPPGTRAHQVHFGSLECGRNLQWRYPFCFCSHAVLQHFHHLGASALCGRKRGDAPCEKESLSDSVDQSGHHCGELPATCGAHALCVILHVCRLLL